MGRLAALRHGFVWCMAFSASACLYDEDDRCGPHQKYDGVRCVCAEGYGLSANRCVACGANEIGSLAGCDCAPGYSRPAPQMACEPQGALGQACESDQDCQHPVFSYCHLSGAEGYCTRPNCTSSSDCDTDIDYACNLRASPSFCEKPPSGLGTACSSSEQCSGFEASYCERLSAQVCLPSGCKADPNKCHGDWVCCDIGILGESLCIPPYELEEGACPVGGTLIGREG